MGIFKIFTLPFRLGIAGITIFYTLVCFLLLLIFTITGVLSLFIVIVITVWTIGTTLLMWSWRKAKWSAKAGIIVGTFVLEESTELLEEGAEQSKKVMEASVNFSKKIGSQTAEKTKWTLKVIGDQLSQPYYDWKLGREIRIKNIKKDKPN